MRCFMLLLIVLTWKSSTTEGGGGGAVLGEELEVCAVERRIYQTSQEDQWWLDNIVRVANSNQFILKNRSDWEEGCARMNGTKTRRMIHAYLKLLRLGRLSGFRRDIMRDMGASFKNEGLPYFHIISNCTRPTRYLPIEPLVINFVAPFFSCATHIGNEKVRLHDQNSLIYSSHALEIGIREDKPHFQSTFLFGIGSSYEHSPLSTLAISWLMNSYKSQGILFDHVFIWNHHSSINRLHSDQLVSSYNLSADTSPLDILQNIGAPSDFIVFCLDINHAGSQTELLREILSSPQLLTLIDEFYFMHHVNRNPLAQYGKGNPLYPQLLTKESPFTSMSSTVAQHDELEKTLTRADKFGKDNNLTAAFKILYRLRQYGIRAHSWA